MSHTEVFIIRHGQANSAAKTEKDYDQLSDLGWQQARWLGAYFANLGLPFDGFATGNLRRHKETMSGINLAQDWTVDPRLNELRYIDMANALLDRRGIPLPTGHEEFPAHFPKVMAAWEDGIFDDLHTPYVRFQSDALAAIADMAKGRERVMLVSSGGIIETILASLFGHKMSNTPNCLGHVLNTSVHVFNQGESDLRIKSYHTTPHLDAPDRHHARTHV